jgi:hypothetical protein
MTTLLVSFDVTDPVTPEDRRRLKDRLGDLIREHLDTDVPVSIDVLATPVKDLNERPNVVD